MKICFAIPIPFLGVSASPRAPLEKATRRLTRSTLSVFPGFIAVFCLSLAFPATSHAESQEFGDYTVYYQAVNSTFLKPDIASRYGIVRGDRSAFLNISVSKRTPEGAMVAVPAAVGGGRKNLLGQVGAISFREIREDNAIYYLGEFEFSNAEIVRFEISVQPEATGPSRTITWETRMYSN